MPTVWPLGAAQKILKLQSWRAANVHCQKVMCLAKKKLWLRGQIEGAPGEVYDPTSHIKKGREVCWCVSQLTRHPVGHIGPSAHWPCWRIIPETALARRWATTPSSLCGTVNPSNPILLPWNRQSIQHNPSPVPSNPLHQPPHLLSHQAVQTPPPPVEPSSHPISSCSIGQAISPPLLS